jgi:hypothetical protein
MKKLMAIVLGTLIGIAFTVPAVADVDVQAEIYKYKSVSIYEDIYIDKDIDITVNVDVEPEGAAEALALSNQEIDNQFVNFNMNGDDGTPPPTDVDPWLDAKLQASVNLNIGITGVNQDVGNANNQGNVVAIAVTAAPKLIFANAEASAEQEITNSEVDVFIDASDFDPDSLQKTSQMLRSVIGNTGITNVNQSSGNMNNQVNMVSLAVGLVGTVTDDTGAEVPRGGPLVALAEADLGQYSANNTVNEINTVKGDLMVNSVKANSGITQVNQTTGNFNNQANVVAIGTAHTP